MEFKLNDYHRNISDEELIKDIIKVANTLDKETISCSEYVNNGGKYHYSTICRRFGGWIKALQKCNLSPNYINRSINLEDMIKDLQDTATRLGKKKITCSEYLLYGKYSSNIFIRKFGTWNNALTASGLEIFDPPLGGGTKNKVSEYKCLEEIERIWTKLGRQPTTTDIKNGISKYSLHVYERRFGSWRKALEFFVSYINEERDVEKKNDLNENIKISEFIPPDLDNVQKRKTKRDINLRMRFKVMKRDNFKCCICGRSPATTPGLELHIDHIKPWSKGGETTIDNLQTLCSDCNIGKSDIQ